MTDNRSLRPSARLCRLLACLQGQRVSVGDIAARLGADGALGLLLLLLAIPAIVPSPGLPIGAVFGTAIAVIALQTIAGVRSLRLPRWLARRRFDTDRVRAAVRRVAPLLRRIDRRLKPRLIGLTRPWAVRLIGLVVLIQGVLITLPIPFGNTLPGLAVLVLALGLTARDGAAVAAGVGLSVVAFAVSAALAISTVQLGGAVLRA